LPLASPTRDFLLLRTWSVLAADLSPDGTQALSAGEDGVGILWNVATGEELGRFTSHPRDAIFPGVTFSPNGNTAFSVGGSMLRGDGRAIQWRIAEPDVTELIDWIYANRYVRDLTCAERVRFAVGQPCE
jgi:WD40 repeat protein